MAVLAKLTPVVPLKHKRYTDPSEPTIRKKGLRAMTLCIAAHCQHEGEPHVVMCCDWLTGDDVGSSETCDKLGAIKSGWPVLIADVVHKADELIGWFEKNLDPTTVNKDNVLQVVRDISHSYMCKLRDEKSFLHYGASVPKLVAEKAFSRKEIAEISEGLNSRATLILATILDGESFIFEIQNDGEVIQQPEYAIIGITDLASAFMQWRCVTGSDELGAAIYDVYESKRFAEMKTDIGHDTSMYVLKPDGHVHRVKSEYLQKLDKYRRRVDEDRRSLEFDPSCLWSKG